MNGRLVIFFSLVWFCLLAGKWSSGQQVFISVLDNKTSEPVPFAHVCLEGLKSGTSKYALTGIDGTVPNEVKEISKIAVSYMGYSTYTDTLRPGQALEVRLKPVILNMNEVVVTAQYTPERADKSIYKVDVINSRQIELKAATNMADLLKDQTAMRVSQDGVLGTSLRIQGLSGQNVKFLMDGVPLIGRMNGNFDLNQLNLYNIDHVEVIEGPMSVIYGSNALAGVINLITKENKSSVMSTAANGYVESVGVYNFDAAVSMNLKKHGFSIDGGRNFFSGYTYYDSSRSQTFKPRRQYFFDGYYTYNDKRFKLKAAGDYFNEKLEDRGPLLPAYYETAFDSWFSTVRYSVRTDASVKLPGNHFITLLGAYSSYQRTKKTYYKDLTTGEENLVTGPSAQDTTGISSWTGRGTFARNTNERKFNFQAGVDLDVETGTGQRISGGEQSIGDYAAFLSLKWDPVRSLAIQPGIRFIYNTKYQAPLVYALSVRWKITSATDLRFGYARGFRAPDLKELYLVFQDINHDITGNPDLVAENSNNFNLNFHYSKEKTKTAWSADVTGFYNIVNNVILLARYGSELQYTYVNLQKYKTTGGVLTGSFSFYPSLKIDLGIGETGIAASADASEPLYDFVFTTDVTVSGSWRFLKPELTLSLFYKYTGRTPEFALDQESVSIQYISPYHMMDFTATKGFWSNRIRVSGGVKNIFDVKAVPSTGAVAGAHSGGGGSSGIGWGRTLFLKLSIFFNKYK